MLPFRRNCFRPQYVRVWIRKFRGYTAKFGEVLHTSPNLVSRLCPLESVHNNKCLQVTVGRAFHKLLEIFQKVSRNFSKSCSKKKLKVAFRDESCSKVARKNENFFGSDDKIWKLFNKSKISKYFCAILRRNQIC